MAFFMGKYYRSKFDSLLPSPSVYARKDFLSMIPGIMIISNKGD